MLSQRVIHRVGECQDCGDCCILYVDGNYKRCIFYNLKVDKHCTAYDARPQVCRDFPRAPIDVQDKPICGFRFLDDKGCVVDGYEDPRTRLRLIHAIKKLKKKGIM